MTKYRIKYLVSEEHIYEYEVDAKDDAQVNEMIERNVLLDLAKQVKDTLLSSSDNIIGVEKKDD